MTTEHWGFIMAGLLAGTRTATTRTTHTTTVALDESAPVDRRRLAALLGTGHQVIPLSCALAGVVDPDVLVTWSAATVPADQLRTIWPTAAVIRLPTSSARPDLPALAARLRDTPADRYARATRPAGTGAGGWWADGGTVRVRLATHRLWPAGTVLDDADLVVWGGPHPAAVGCALTATGYRHHDEPVVMRLIASAGRRGGGRVTLHGWATTGDDRVHLLLEGRLRLGPTGPTATRTVELALTGRAPDVQPDRRFRLHLRARQTTRGPVPESLVVPAG